MVEVNLGIKSGCLTVRQNFSCLSSKLKLTLFI
jgi:hypothetical protein